MAGGTALNGLWTGEYDQNRSGIAEAIPDRLRVVPAQLVTMLTPNSDAITVQGSA